MATPLRVASAILTASLAVATPLSGAEPSEEMRTFARILAALEARNLKGYCTAMHGTPAYSGYLSRACQSGVQNNVRKPEECVPEGIARQVRTDLEKCLAMPADEFEKQVQRGGEASKAFVKQATSESVDGEKLLQDERVKLR